MNTRLELVGLALLLGLFVPAVARGFPGLVVGKTDARARVSTTHVVVLHHADIDVITLSIDYQGPQAPFALLVPVPPDVRLNQVKSVKHEFIGRLEELTAPRVSDFWEKNPCEAGPAEQVWEEKVPVKNRGFLTPEVLPPRDDYYPITNELSLPAEPVFKGSEGEFSYHLLRPRKLETLTKWLDGRGYHGDARALARLFEVLEKGAQLLVAEVSIDHAELVASDHLQLGGIRFFTRKGLPALDMALNDFQKQGRHDLFVYTLDRAKRYEAQGEQNVFAPTNLRVTPDLDERVGLLYSTLFERIEQKHPAAFVTEYVGFSDECGEPCSDAPLQLRELLTLGGDVIESLAVSPAEHSPPPLEPTPAERRVLEAKWAAMPPHERLVAEREHTQHLKRLAQRRALVQRQRYVITRLHRRSSGPGEQRSLELRSTGQGVQGGFGVPRGPAAELESGTSVKTPSRYQVRFFATHPWQGTMPCKAPARWRWGKRWKSESQHYRKLSIARDLPRLGTDAALLDKALLSSVPELGLRAVSPPAEPPPPPPTAPAESGCSLKARAPRNCALGALLLAVSAGCLGGFRMREARKRRARRQRDRRR